MRAKLESLVHEGQTTTITFSVKQKVSLDYNDCELEVKKYFERRSREANNYAWALIGKIAEKTAQPKEEVYEEMLRRYGQGGILQIADSCAESVLREIKYWVELESVFGKNSKLYRVLVGSSNYNSQEMAKFIDGVVSEAQALDIETLTPLELERLKENWK